MSLQVSPTANGIFILRAVEWKTRVTDKRLGRWTFHNSSIERKVVIFKERKHIRVPRTATESKMFPLIAVSTSFPGPLSSSISREEEKGPWERGCCWICF